MLSGSIEPLQQIWLKLGVFLENVPIWVAADSQRRRNKETGTQLTVIYIATNITGLKYIQYIRAKMIPSL